jgi:hypothetical protein
MSNGILVWFVIRCTSATLFAMVSTVRGVLFEREIRIRHPQTSRWRFPPQISVGQLESLSCRVPASWSARRPNSTHSSPASTSAIDSRGTHSTLAYAQTGFPRFEIPCFPIVHCTSYTWIGATKVPSTSAETSLGHWQTAGTEEP